MISYAQNFEDVMLARAFDDRGDGFYVDIGACFPDLASVTKHFYDKGWSGINVEPMTEPFSRLVAARARDVNLNIAIAGYSGDIAIYHGPSIGESSAKRPDASARPMLVPCLTLADLCRQYAVRQIDFLKIDVEGLERDVVLSGDWTAFRPTIVVTEVTSAWTANRRPDSIEICAHLTGNGYREIYFDGLNAFYLASEASELAPRFSYPPSVLDRFYTAREAGLIAGVELNERGARLLAADVAAKVDQAGVRVRDADLRAVAAQAETRQCGVLLAEATARAIAADELSVRVHAALAVANHELDAERARVSTALAETRQTGNLLREIKTQALAAEEQSTRTKAELAKTNQKLAATNLDLTSTEARARHAEASFAAIERSNSWRLTAPLRRLRGRTKRATLASTYTWHQQRGLAANLLRGVIRVAKRRGVFARVAPWMREHFPTFWLSAKQILLQDPGPQAEALRARPKAASPPQMIGASPPETVQSGISFGQIPGSQTVTKEELKKLIELEMDRQRRS